MTIRRKGMLVGRNYRLLERIGAGDVGEVWSARHERNLRECAVKLVEPAWEVSASAMKAYLHDLQASGHLEERTIVKLLDSGVTDEGIPYVVMPLLHAEKLEHLLARRGALTMGTALRIIADLSAGIAVAHEAGIWHRSIEPANVLLHRDPRGKVVPTLVDFGIVRLAGTRHFGPIGYLAPEQAEGELGDGRADVWSLALLLVHALEGRPPFVAKDTQALLKVIDVGLVEIEKRISAMDPKVGALVRDALMRDRHKRPTARMFARRMHDLSAWAHGQTDGLAMLLELPEPLEREAALVK